MTRRIFFVAALLLAVIGIALFYQSAAVNSRSEGDAPLYSAQRYDPYGTAALRDLLTERGIPVRTLERPNLDAGDDGVLVQVLPFGQTPGNLEAGGPPTDQLISWMMQGNTVIQMSRKPTDLMTQLKIVASTRPSSDDLAEVQQFESDGNSPDDTPARQVVAKVQMPQSSGTARASSPLSLLLWSPMVLVDPTGVNAHVIARQTGNGASAVALMMSVGRGRFFIIGAPTPALNGTLGAQENLDFLLSAIGNGPVILDEWSHGIGHNATMIEFIHDIGLLPLLIQVGFLVLLYVWSTAGHRGNDPLVAARQRSSIEQIQTLGYLYSRSFGAVATFRQVNAEVERRLCEVMRCGSDQLAASAGGLKPELRRRFDELAEAMSHTRPEHGVQCPHCQYELYSLKSERCPECGTPISAEVRNMIDQAARQGPPGAQRHRNRLDAGLANLLTMSHQFMLEVQRDRRAK